MPRTIPLPDARPGSSKADRAIREAVLRGASQDGLPGDISFQGFFHLSEMRRSLFNWFSFDAAASLLEVNAGHGALTGLFCERCARVSAVTGTHQRAGSIAARCEAHDNLDIYVGGWRQLAARGQYDIVVAAGLWHLQPSPAAFLRELAAFLRPGGKLLLACDNRYGVRYLCGERDEGTGLPFGGVNGLPPEKGSPPPARPQLLSLLEGAGFGPVKLYYPLPDWRFPQIVFTDARPPDEQSVFKALPYSRDTATLVSRETEWYLDVVREGTFPFLANAFLAECLLPGEPQASLCDVEMAALSADRPPAHRFATTLHAGGAARKAPLAREAEQSLRDIGKNLDVLAGRGLVVVPHRLREAAGAPALEMPTVEDELLAVALRHRQGDRQAVFHLYDLLWEAILASSPPAEECAFAARHPGLDFGPVLERAYIEMIPLNCFWNGRALAFFDQEFVFENTPARFIMFRAFYFTNPSATAIPTVAELSARYGIDAAQWAVFLAEEGQFQDWVHGHGEANKPFFDRCTWAISPKIIEENLRALERRGEGG